MEWKVSDVLKHENLKFVVRDFSYPRITSIATWPPLNGKRLKLILLLPTVYQLSIPNAILSLSTASFQEFLGRPRPRNYGLTYKFYIIRKYFAIFPHFSHKKIILLISLHAVS
ncbi:hypothetical protein ACKWTF_004067 [Chironomus riparius]